MGVYGLRSALKIPESIVYGSHTVEELGQHTLRYGKRAVLILGGRSLEKSGNYEKILSILKKDKISIEEIRGITHDPDEVQVNGIVEKVRIIRPDAVIGIGGGSVIDTAKAVSIIATCGGEVRDYWTGREFDRPSIPYIAVPTTSGTGAEITKNAVITSHDHLFKKSIRSEYMIPNIALVDPMLTISMPPELTAQTGLDALIQNLEAYTSKNAGPITDTLAREGIGLAGRYLIRACTAPEKPEPREGLSLAALYGGITLANAGLGLAHGLSHPLGIRFNIPHGKACAMTMPGVIELNYPARKDRYDEVAKLLKTGPDAVSAFSTLLVKLGISTKLGDYGVTKAHIPLIVDESKGGSRRFNPIDHSDETVATLLERLL
jgi:alcohol dehydrogenase class IV